MTRNTLRRGEGAAPIYDPALKDRIREMFELMLRDNVKARVQQPDGTYVKKERLEGEEAINSQEVFFEEAFEEAERAASI